MQFAKTNYTYIACYFLYVLIGWLINSYYYDDFHRTIYELSFHYGELLDSLAKKGIYAGTYRVNTNDVYLTFTAHRLPLVTYFILLISKILGTANVAAISLVKNLIWQWPMGMGMYYYFTAKKPVSLLVVCWIVFMLFFPRTLLSSFTIGMEEGYVIPVMGGFFGILFFNQREDNAKYTQLMVLLLLSFWLKNTFMYLLPVVMLILALRKKDARFFVKGMAGYLLSILLLMTFNYYSSGKFTARYPFKYWNLYKGNNEKTLDYYPKYTLDAFDYLYPILQPGMVNDEWEFDDFYKKQYEHFLETDPQLAFKGYLVKLFTLTIDIRPNGKFYKDGGNSKLEVVGMFFMLVLRICQWLSLYLSLLFLVKSRNYVDRFSVLLYLAFLGLYLLPYIIGWGTERHISPLFTPVFLSIPFLTNKCRQQGIALFPGRA